MFIVTLHFERNTIIILYFTGYKTCIDHLTMATEKDTQQNAPVLKEKEATLTLDQSTNKLAKYGGFDLLETTIDGVSNMNPARKARKNIFLAEATKKSERKELKKRLKLWKQVLSSNETIADMVQNSQGRVESAQKQLVENLGKAVNASRTLETSYRSVALFYKNTDEEKIKNLSIMNAEMEQIQDLDLDRAYQVVEQEISSKYDKLDLKENYSMLVMPGYLGSNPVISKWAKMAHKNKVMMVTDFAHLDTPEDVVDMFESAKHTGADAHLANVIMTSNWLVGRGKYEELGEQDEDMYVPPAAALAGRIYSTLASQVTAGRKHGTLNEVDGVRFELKKSEISQMEKIGLVPMVNEYGRVMAFSAKTLFNGDNIGLQTYSVVRVFDWVTKVLIDFLNRRAFENWDHNLRMDIQSQIVRFLDNITGPGKLIEKFTIKNFARDPKQKDRILLDIHMIPYFPAKTFLISLDGTKGDDPDSNDRDWNSSYEQK